MSKAIRMPDLDLFVPGFLDLSFRGGGEEFEQCIVISRWFVPHRSLSDRMLKKSASVVLASKASST